MPTAEFIDFRAFDRPVKLTYRLANALLSDPQRVRDTQALTLNPDKPFLGLKGNKGLFASEEWWGNIKNGQIPTLQISGIIQRAYFAGWDSGGLNNSIDILQDNGEVEKLVGIYVNRKADVKLFQVGKFIWIIYATDEMKDQSGDIDSRYSKIALKMAVEVNENQQ